MNINNYKFTTHCLLYFGRKIALSKIIKDCYHKNYYGDSGGKVEDGEDIRDAIYREIKLEIDY